MNKEDYFISSFSSKNIGDDGAVVGAKVYSKDLFCENIHFKRSWMSLSQIAKKSMLINISDAIVMNSKPKYALIGIIIPSSFTYKELKELSSGFEEVVKEYGIEIIGGDTTSGKELMISVTIISDTKKPTFRSGMKQGNLIAYSGNLGNSYKGLTKLLRGGKLSSNSRFVTPKLRGSFFYEVAKYITASLDISDGLSKDLSRICKSSGGFDVDFFKHMPKEILCSGEEYEVLFSFSPKNLSIIKNIAKKHRVKLNVFGKAKRGRYKNCCKENHFR